MPRFTTRVELHQVSSYDSLHAEMVKYGFSPTIQGSCDTVYNMPTAEYNFEGEVTREYVLSLAKSAVVVSLLHEPQKIKQANHPPTVFITESQGRIWSGLRQLPEPTM